MMDSVPRSQVDVLGIPLLDGLGGDDGVGAGHVWRTGNIDSLSLVHSYNLQPGQEIVMGQPTNRDVIQDTPDLSPIISFKRPIFYEGLHSLYSSGDQPALTILKTSPLFLTFLQF